MELAVQDVGSLVEEWETFVTEIKEGYDDSWDEYLFYLNLRDAITDKRDALDSSQRSRVAKADEIFRSLTTDYTMARMRSVVVRIPVRPGTQLAADLEAFGYVPADKG